MPCEHMRIVKLPVRGCISTEKRDECPDRQCSKSCRAKYNGTSKKDLAQKQNYAARSIKKTGRIYHKHNLQNKFKKYELQN
jgi:hypothetical protein